MTSPRGKVLAILSILAIGVGCFVSWNSMSNRTPYSHPDRDYSKSMFMPRETTLAPGIHMLGRLRRGMVYVIETSDGPVMVDSGLEPNGSVVTPQLELLELDLSKLRAIFLTHAHGDHTLGARMLSGISGAKVYAGKGDCEVLRAGTSRDAFFSTYPMDRFPIHGTPIDVELEGGEILKFGDTEIEAIATPGHTPGSMCYRMMREGKRCLFTGDTVSSLTGDPGTYAAYLPPKYRGNAFDYLDSLRSLRAMPDPDLVFPGHPLDGNTRHGPNVTPQQWEKLLDSAILELAQLVNYFKADGQDFLDNLPKEILPDLYYLGDRSGRAVYLLSTSSGQFLFDAPGPEGLLQFVEDRLKELGVEKLSLAGVLLTSVDKDSTAELASVVTATGCRVVVAESGRQWVEENCPMGTVILTPSEFEKAELIPAKTIPLGGYGVAPLGYFLAWKDKNVLIAGRHPNTLDGAAVPGLVRAIEADETSAAQYSQSIKALRRLKPDLWFPAFPSYGQNANLYGNQWINILQGNDALVAKYAR